MKVFGAKYAVERVNTDDSYEIVGNIYSQKIWAFKYLEQIRERIPQKKFVLIQATQWEFTDKK